MKPFSKKKLGFANFGSRTGAAKMAWGGTSDCNNLVQQPPQTTYSSRLTHNLPLPLPRYKASDQSKRLNGKRCPIELTCNRDALYIGIVNVMLIGPVSFFRLPADQTKQADVMQLERACQDNQLSDQNLEHQPVTCARLSAILADSRAERDVLEE